MADATATEQQTTSEHPNEVRIEDIGPAAKRLTITVPAEAIAEKLDDSINALSAEASVPGFRKGRVPRRLLERRFGSAVRTETRNQIVAEAYSAAIEEHELKPVGEPEPVEELESLELKDGEPLTFSIDVEVVPDFDLPALGDIDVKKPTLDITDEMIEREVERQRFRFGEAKEVNSDFQPLDRLIGRAVVTKVGEDEPVLDTAEAQVVVPAEEDNGRGTVLGLIIEDLDKVVAGHSVGDTLTIETTIPEGHERPDLRGAEVGITFEIRRAQRIEPAAVDDILSYFGLADENMMREQIRFALEQRRDEEQRSAMRQQLYQRLADMVDFDLPTKLSEAQIARHLEQERLELLNRGLPPEEAERQIAEMRGQSAAEAQRRLKLFFIIRRFADEFDIEVTEQEINGRIANIAVQNRMRPEQLRTELVRSGRVQLLANQLREEKTAERMLQDVKVEEVTAEEWQAMQGGEDGASGGGGASGKKKKKSSRKKKATT